MLHYLCINIWPCIAMIYIYIYMYHFVWADQRENQGYKCDVSLKRGIQIPYSWFFSRYVNSTNFMDVDHSWNLTPQKTNYPLQCWAFGRLIRENKIAKNWKSAICGIYIPQKNQLYGNLYPGKWCYSLYRHNKSTIDCGFEFVDNIESIHLNLVTI